ncbi:MAG: DUF72 domain-containing protein [Conexivisphaerales archaeon]
MELYVGTGGWEYFNAQGDKLAAYAKLFNFVEVNSTFYFNPSLKTVRTWRSRVPKDFEFSVKCNRIITHKYVMDLTAESITQAEYTVRICQLLRSGLAILQTPASIEITSERIRSWKPLIDIFRENGITPVLEARSTVDKKAIDVMNELGILSCIDLTSREPVKSSDVLYSRLFGSGTARFKGFSDKEYILIEQRLKSAEPKKAYLAFHGIQMYADALQFKRFSSQKVL